MKKQKYPMTNENWGRDEDKALRTQVAKRLFSMGKTTREFEQRFARKMGRKFAFMTSSGSMANLLGVAAFQLHSAASLPTGSEVIAPLLGWSTTYFPFHQYGCHFRFVDIDPKTLNVSAEAVAAAITPQTKAIVAISILGNPAPLDELRLIAKKNKLLLLEDNCESMGAKLNNKFTGTFGDISTFSLYYSHQIHAIEAGVITTNSPELAEIIACIRTHGWGRDVPLDSKLWRGDRPSFPEEYRFLLPGYNGKPNDLAAAVGIAQLGKLEKNIKTRRKNAKIFQATFDDHHEWSIPREHGESSWFGFPLVLSQTNAHLRAQVFAALRKAGIDFRLVAGGNITRHPAAHFLKYSLANGTTHADAVHDRGFFVGNHNSPMQKEFAHLHKVLVRTLAKKIKRSS